MLLGEVTDIDLERPHGHPPACSAASTVTPYDSLLVAAGAGQSYFGNDQFAEFAPGMKSIDDALELRGRIFGAFELAEIMAAKGEDVDHLLTFVVVGAGPDRRGDGRPDRRAVRKRTLKRDFRSINSQAGPRDPGRRRRPGAAAVRRASWARRARRRWRTSASRSSSARWSPTSTSAASRCRTRTAPSAASSRSPRSGPPACRPARSARPSPSSPAPGSTAPAASRSTPTSPCRATPRCSSSAT